MWWTRRSAPAPLNYHAMRAVLRRANDSLGTNWSLHDFRHTAAARLLADPAFTLVDVQTVLRHASVATTQIYTQPRLEDLVGKVLEHYARPPALGPTVETELRRCCGAGALGASADVIIDDEDPGLRHVDRRPPPARRPPRRSRCCHDPNLHTWPRSRRTTGSAGPANCDS